MAYDDYIEITSETKADVQKYIEIAFEDKEFRTLLVMELLNNDKINVYYHSYTILSEVASVKPELLVDFLWEFYSLLEYDNSYHRNYGMDIISSIATEIDSEVLQVIIPVFCQLLNDEKISTRKYCITYSTRLIIAKPQFADIIVEKIITSLVGIDLNPKHHWLLIKEFMKLLEDVKLTLDENSILFFKNLMNDDVYEKYRRKIGGFIKKRSLV